MTAGQPDSKERFSLTILAGYFPGYFSGHFSRFCLGERKLPPGFLGQQVPGFDRFALEVPFTH